MTYPAPASPAPAAPRRRPGGWRILAVLVPLLGIGAALWAGQGALTTRLYPDRTGVVGEIIAGRHVGQTFITQYAGLSGVDLYTANYLHVLTGNVVLHVRADAHATADLATVAVPAATLPNNDWITFAFPPLAAPAGTPLYLELAAPQAALGAAPTVYWYSGPGDPYGSGQTVFDGQSQPGDLAFGLRYSPPPWEPWLRTLGAIAARLPTRPAWTLPLAALLLLGLLGWWALGVGGWRRAARSEGSGIRDQGSGSRFTFHVSRFTLPAAVLLIAGAHAWLWLWLVPPWQGPDEPQHLAAAALWARQPPGAILTGSPVPDPAAAPDLAPAILAAMDRHGFTRTVTWYGEKGGPAAHFIDRPAFGGSSLYVQVRQPSLYYRGGALALWAASGGNATRLDPDIALYLLRGWSLLWQVILVALGGLAAARLTPGRPGAALRVALPLGLALWPMPVFIHTVANNDVLAGVFVAGTLVAALGWLGTPAPFGPRGLGWGALTLALAGASLLTKSTAAVAGLVFGGAAVLLAWRGARGWLARRPPRAWAGAGLAALLVLIGLLALAGAGVDRQHTAAGWSYGIAVHAGRRTAPDAHGGGWVLAPPADQPVSQRVDLPPGHPPVQLDAAAWVRTAPSGPAQLALQVDSRTVSSRTLTLPGGAAWTPIGITGTAPAGSLYATVVLVGGAGLEADDLSLTAAALAPGAGPLPGGNLLGNPSAEIPATALAPPLRGLLAWLPGLDADQLVDALLNPLPFDGPAAVREFLIVEAQSFLGLFGWLSIPLPEAWYTFWTLAAGLGVLGLPFAWPRLSRLEREWLVLSVAVVTAGVGLSVAKSLAQWALFGLRDPPQGRYLFVLLIPILWLGLTGARGILDFGLWILGRFGFGEMADRSWAGVPRLALWVWGTLLLVFTAWALLALVVPYYYGG